MANREGWVDDQLFNEVRVGSYQEKSAALEHSQAIKIIPLGVSAKPYG